MIKHKLIILTCFLLVIGIIESVLAMQTMELDEFYKVTALIVFIFLFIIVFEIF